MKKITLFLLLVDTQERETVERPCVKEENSIISDQAHTCQRLEKQ